MWGTAGDLRAALHPSAALPRAAVSDATDSILGRDVHSKALTAEEAFEHHHSNTRP